MTPPPASTVTAPSSPTTPPTPNGPAKTVTAPLASASAPRRPSRRAPRWIPYAGGLILVALLVAAFRPVPAPVETATVSKGTLRTLVNEEGRTRIRQKFVVSAPVAGVLRRIPFKAGAEVQAGTTVLAVIDPIPPALLDARSRSLAEARRDAALANLDKHRTAHRFAAGDLARFQKLFGEGTVSAQELESFQWREAAAAKELASAESTLRQAEAELAEFNAPTASASASDTRKPIEVTAPASGKILRVIEENSRVVTPGAPLLELGDPADLEVVIEVLSRDGAAIRPGTRIELDQWGSPETLVAKVRLVEPAAFTKISALGVEEQRVRVIADLLTPPEKRPGLGDGFRVEAHIVAWETPDALRAPTGALFRRGREWAAYVIDHGRAALRRVELGRTGGVESQVLGGLAEGDTVILYPGERVKEGDRVKPIRIAP